MQWEIVVGLETHAQLMTKSKIFSGASIAFGAEPNVQACAVDLALPGVLPVMNKGAVEHAIRFGLAVGAKVAEHSVFARKNYFYPDLPKGYQISQFEIPVVQGGSVSFLLGDQMKTVRLTRAHLEEDAGKSLHEDFAGQSGIDLNRAGTPLLEIVTEPDMRSADEAVAYAKALHTLVTWLGICDGNMQEGSFRCDANVSVRPKGQEKFGTRCEIKNLNSFKFLHAAILYEAQRQIEIIEDGGVIKQETRLYDPDRNETRSMRSKEDSEDYRYFPDPDLPPLTIASEWIERVKGEMPELPGQKQARYESELGLPTYDAVTLTASRAMTDYFEATLAVAGNDKAKTVANWLLGEFSASLNRDEKTPAEAPLAPAQLAALVARIADGTLNNKTAKQVFAALWDGKYSDVDACIKGEGLQQISDSGAVEKMVDEVLAAHPGPVAEYKAGKEASFNFLVGQVMRAARGKANPAQVNDILKARLTA
ncbi:MAG TPA: Asp-tRNA(Asn)/Glu-tRNA(Gln) amidotransferase subunit GatB [Limnobacter sp.]|uniref:Asp-tRNA(Asn)/Glu-tRNA(Gln) amidotransferase subunit GatB n=1 Tax=Limnobacter sp. TaxID=2003368 RepID=UPI002EDAC3FD